MKLKLGLTGSIGMGKSTTAQMFVEEGCDLWDADAAVHRLYAQGGAAVEPMGQAFPDSIKDGEVSRERLRSLISADPEALQTIEKIVHPLVAEDRARFSAISKQAILVFDIPLLFETGGAAAMDATVCVHVDAATQRARVLARGTMNAAQFEQILAKQMPIADKLARADYHIETDTLDHARAQVQDIVTDLTRRLHNA